MLVFSSAAAACLVGEPGTVERGVSGFPAISGLAHDRGEIYLFVEDRKHDEEGPRLSALSIPASGVPQGPVPLDVDWTPAGDIPTDLESIAAVPGRGGEFLLGESGNKDDRTGRLIHVRVTGDGAAALRVAVLGKVDLPPDIHNSEGMALAPRDDGLLTLVICERDERKVTDARGDDPRFALLGFSRIDLDAYRLLGPVHAARVTAPEWPEGGTLRTCTDLHWDEAGTLWLASSYAPETDEEADSIVYRVDPAAATADRASASVVWRVPAMKIEGITTPWRDGAGLLVATDEDEHGGTLRSLPAQRKQG